MDEVTLRKKNTNETKKDLDEFEALLDEIQKACNNDPTNIELCDELKYLEWQIRVRRFHEEMQSKLGDRSFDHINSQLLLEKVSPLFLKVGYAFYGEPCQNGKELYGTNESICVKDVCKKIEEISKKLNADGSIYLSIIFIPCLSTNDNDDNVPKTRVLFIVGKENSTDNRIITKIDNKITVYKSWQQFKNYNPFPKCSYALPKDGKYQAGIDGSPLLEFIKFQGENMANKAGNALVNANTDLATAAGALIVASIFAPVLAPVAVGAAAVSSVAKLQKMMKDDRKSSNSNDSKIGRFVNIHETNDTTSRISLSTIASSNATPFLETSRKIVEHILDFKISDNSLKISTKHKELLVKTMNLMIMKHNSGTLEATHTAQFKSFVLFFFNVLIEDHEAYIDKFIENFKETIANILLKDTENYEPKLIQCLKLEKSDDINKMIDALMQDITKVHIQMNWLMMASEIQDTLKALGLPTSTLHVAESSEE